MSDHIFLASWLHGGNWRNWQHLVGPEFCGLQEEVYCCCIFCHFITQGSFRDGLEMAGGQKTNAMSCFCVNLRRLLRHSKKK